MKIKLLDCTLRDGAHVNKGQFGIDSIIDIIVSLIESRVDIVELGFLEDCEYNRDFTFYNNISQCNELLCGLNLSDTEFALMVRPDRCDINKLIAKSGPLNSIRFAFYIEHLQMTIKYAQLAKELGYSCYLNPINITNYTEAELIYLIDACNDIKPKCFSIVDTFGALTIQKFKSLVSLVHSRLPHQTSLGLHLHENLSLSFGLVQEYLLNLKIDRDVVIDASVLGIGRIPGNLPIELVASYLNHSYGKSYNIPPILKVIAARINPIKRKRSWGYSPEYMLSAMKGVHRSYPEYFVEKCGLSLFECDQLIDQISYASRGSHFDAEYAEKLVSVLVKNSNL